MKTVLILLLGVFVSKLAIADENYYVCFNTDSTSQAPANVLVMATMDGMVGLFNAANANPPRAMFSAPVAGATNPATLNFGKVVWQGKSNGFQDFQSASATFSKTGAMTQASFLFSGVEVDYTKCVLDGDN